MKLYYLYKAPILIEGLKCFVGIVDSQLPQGCDSIVVMIQYAEKPNFI